LSRADLINQRDDGNITFFNQSDSAWVEVTERIIFPILHLSAPIKESKSSEHPPDKRHPA
jgi:hypothetical protein